MPTMKERDSRSVTKWTYKGTTSNTQKNNEDQNAPMTACHNPPITSNQGAKYSDT